MIDVSNLTFEYPDGTLALSNVTFKVRRCERVAILGENGSGKTTLFLCIVGLLRPRSGKVLIKGIEVNRKNEDTIRRIVGLVFQNPDDQVFLPKVYDDVAFGLRNMGLDEGEVRRRVTQTLRLLGIENLADKSTSNLSLGQKKRVAIAGVLAMDPEVILIDEPTAGLDHRGILEMFNILEELNENGKTIVVSTHDVEFVESWADKIVVLHRGRCVKVGDRSLLDELESFGMRKPIKRTIMSLFDFELSSAVVEISEDGKFGYGVDDVIPEIDIDLILLRGLHGPVKVKVSESLYDRFLRILREKGVEVIGDEGDKGGDNRGSVFEA